MSSSISCGSITSSRIGSISSFVSSTSRILLVLVILCISTNIMDVTK